jgi:hypothetical protein
MPRKVRQLKSDLRAAGFIERPGRGKGSHSVWVHEVHTDLSVTLAGQEGEDVKQYQEAQVTAAIRASKAAQANSA